MAVASLYCGPQLHQWQWHRWWCHPIALHGGVVGSAPSRAHHPFCQLPCCTTSCSRCLRGQVVGPGPVAQSLLSRVVSSCEGAATQASVSVAAGRDSSLRGLSVVLTTRSCPRSAACSGPSPHPHGNPHAPPPPGMRCQMSSMQGRCGSRVTGRSTRLTASTTPPWTRSSLAGRTVAP